MAKWTEYEMSPLLKTATGRALTAIGLLLEGAAARITPVGQYAKGSGRVGGRLKGSITHATVRENSRPSGPQSQAGDGVSTPSDDLTLHVGTNVEYAPHVEYGTIHMAPQSYLRRAFDENWRAVRDLYARELQRGLRDGK